MLVVVGHAEPRLDVGPDLLVGLAGRDQQVGLATQEGRDLQDILFDRLARS